MTARVDVRGQAVTEVAELAAAHAGLQASMLDRRQVRQAIETRMRAQRIVDAEDYLALCRVSEAERLRVVELTANGETSFFRDRAVFQDLTAWCVARFHARPHRVLRVLSAPCSTGEEAYSVATALLGAGMTANQFSVDALDISSKALERATAGLYGNMSLRGVSIEERKAFLTPVGHGWQVKEAIQRAVHFRQGNLLDAGVLGDAPYDLILSRNMLLYQSTAARQSVAALLAAALAEDGRLVLGTADWGHDLEQWFALEQPVRALAAVHRRVAPADDEPAVEASSVRQVSPVPPDTVSAAKPAPTVTHAAEEQIARTADLYRHALEAHIQKHDAVAERLCRKILYLDPEHLPSLELLAQLHRPHVTPRMRTALSARLTRKRGTAEKEAQ